MLLVEPTRNVCEGCHCDSEVISPLCTLALRTSGLSGIVYTFEDDGISLEVEEYHAPGK